MSNAQPGVPHDLAEHLESAAAMTPPAGVPRDLAEREGHESFAPSLVGVPREVGYLDSSVDERESVPATLAAAAAGAPRPAAAGTDDSSTHQWASRIAQ